MIEIFRDERILSRSTFLTKCDLCYESSYSQIGNDVTVGEKISVVRANDADGTYPNNEIRYSLSSQQSSERATMYFGIDEKTGEIEVLDDLKRELYENYRLSIVATDLGEPISLNTSVTLVIQVLILYINVCLFGVISASSRYNYVIGY